MTIQQEITPDFEAIKKKQNAAWTSGDYAVVGVTLQKVGEELADRLDLVPGSQVLDVAAGNGNATLALARRWHAVTSTDYVQHLLDKGAQRAKAEGFDVNFQIADAENLPFADGQFDAVVSTFGVMFAPNQTKAAAELMRVTRTGGKIGMANWTPDGFIGRLFRVLGAYVAPPTGVKSPALWGDEVWLNTSFSDASSIEIETRSFRFRYRSAEHFIGVFRELYGPVHKAFLALSAEGQADLAGAISELIAEFNQAKDGSVAIDGRYAEVEITK
ncbi:class I SAM-dependent methyltransferase [Cognatiyoonia sp. IB215446]|uniref:class I SAM-dependent methyltransferase n=1 Tax=Cognatiyoonia sp. IB215446 TaxID=3097355 RepID=UPI002A161012|nr:class I SAM-dependent methyltransferase [Cognatiyoonia sp. IB215446]MDX8346957.1 class I SAM-dependent methyltransferase [Cognatiyoonia sp. IB215446]